MKIGFSFGRCIDDILNKRVEYSDVLLIVARTLMREPDDIRDVVIHYINEGYIRGDLQEAVEIGQRLLKDGKLHQPRAFGARVPQVGNGEIWMDLAPTIDSPSDTIQKAWKQYQMLLRLTEEAKPEEPYHIQVVKNLHKEKKIDETPRPPIDDNF